MTDTRTHGQELKSRINEATNLAYRFGPIDGSHHKDWVLQEVIRLVNGWTPDELNNWLRVGTDDEWEPGIIP